MASYRIFACHRCSRRKQKCDRVLPTCSPCQQSGAACTTSDREKSVVQINGKDITRKGYVTTLLERIAVVEKQIGLSGNATVPRHPFPTTSTTSHQGGERHSPPAPDEQRSASLNHPGWPLEGAHMNMDSLSQSAMAEPRGRAGEFLKQLSMPRIITGVTETYGGNPEAPRRDNSLWEGISKYIRHPASDSHRLHIPSSEAYKALETYLDVVDFRFPRLPVAKVKSGFDAITAEDEQVYKTTLSSDPGCIFMAYMVIAIVPLVSDSYPISEGSFVSIQLLGKCLKVLDRVFRQEDGVDVIQCLHLLVIFSIHCSAAGSSWHLIGFAMTKCIALGYHHERASSLDDNTPAEELEQRRWAFWGCYLLDRLICAALFRPHSIDDKYITTSLPREHRAPINPGSYEAFHIHLFHYAQLLSAVTCNDTKEDFIQLLGRALHWRTTTPRSTDSSSHEPYLYQTSLFHTLMLRISIRELLNLYEFDNPEGSHVKIRYALHSEGDSEAVSRLSGLEKAMLQRTRLFDACRAVAQSLDRPRMSRRHFLSHLTAYSAFSMALAALYCQAAIGRESLGDLNPDSHTTACPNGSILGPTSRIKNPQGVDLEKILTVACQKLEIVGRQFPKVNEYKQIIEMMQDQYCMTPSKAARTERDQQLHVLYGLVERIGPSHLRELAQVVLFFKGP